MNNFKGDAPIKIAVVGLGYVGLPLAVGFGSRFETVAFDIKKERIAELRVGRDTTNEVPSEEISKARYLTFTNEDADVDECNLFIVTVPTPVDSHKKPDLRFLEGVSALLAGKLAVGDVVVYESTVFPGCTEEVCIPILEDLSGFACGKDFYVGYSPERINPGDKVRSLQNVKKVVSGSSTEVSRYLRELYECIVTAGVYTASSIKVAEASKILENTQRDVNIGLMNEVALLFQDLDISMQEVLEAAKTKWNFLDFQPGLVGGHCIGVDPYYLLHKASETGADLEVIRSARRSNEMVVPAIFNKSLKLLHLFGESQARVKVLLVGFAFKENCADVRNTRVFDLYEKYIGLEFEVEIYDPLADRTSALTEYGVNVAADIPAGSRFDLVIVCVPHDEIKSLGAQKIGALAKNPSLVMDIKSAFNESTFHNGF